MEITRRVFLRYASGAAAAVGLASVNLAQLEELFAASGAPPIIWLSGSACTGCSVSLLNAVNPTVDELLTQTVNLVYHPNLMSAAGDLAVSSARATALAGNYILVIEGAIPTAAGGKYCYVWDEGGRSVTMAEAVTSLAAGAKHIVSVGSCASFGGIPKVNAATGAQGVGTYLGKPVINLPGCPAHPDWIIGSLSALLTGTVISLDSQNRPTSYYTKEPIHERCPRKDAQKAKLFGINGACLKELGCKGPETHADCDRRWWNNAQNWCIGANALCIGCTESNFPAFPLHKGVTFSQPQPAITVTSPNGGENWAVGSTQVISWTSAGVSGNVDIHLSRDGGATWSNLASDITNSGTYLWTVSGAASVQARVRISSASNTDVADTSNSNFTIGAMAVPTIQVTSPNGGENWVIGSSQSIKWTSSNVSGNVNVLFSRDGGITWSIIAGNIANSGIHAWKVNSAATTHARIQVVSANNAAIADAGDANFTITAATPTPATITINSPKEGDDWKLGSKREIRWKSTDQWGQVSVSVSRDAGLTWQNITNSTANDGKYEWKVSGATTKKAAVRVARSDSPGEYGLSNGFFKISKSD